MEVSTSTKMNSSPLHVRRQQYAQKVAKIKDLWKILKDRSTLDGGKLSDDTLPESQSLPNILNPLESLSNASRSMGKRRVLEKFNRSVSGAPSFLSRPSKAVSQETLASSTDTKKNISFLPLCDFQKLPAHMRKGVTIPRSNVASRYVTNKIVVKSSARQIKIEAMQSRKRVQIRRRRSILNQIQRRRSTIAVNFNVSESTSAKSALQERNDSDDSDDDFLSLDGADDDGEIMFGVGYVSEEIIRQRSAVGKIEAAIDQGFVSPQIPRGMMNSLHSFVVRHKEAVDKKPPLSINVPSLSEGRRFRSRESKDFKTVGRSMENCRVHSRPWA